MAKLQRVLLGSAAGLTVAAGAQAADLPIKKAAPVEYVRVCTAYGPGFFYIPGTDTCIRIGGMARFEYEAAGPRKRGIYDYSSYRGMGRLQLDARTATDWGTLRTFVRFDVASRTGGWPLYGATTERMAQSFYATGVDTYGRAQKYVEVDKAFIQFAGLTAGRFSSFYDFYGHAHEFIGYSPSSEVQSTNGIAYTAKLGGGFSATLSVEDPTFRRSPVYYASQGYSNQVPGSYIASGITNLSYLGTTAFANVALTYGANGLPTSYASVDVAQRNQVPDIIGVLRYDGGWGSAQVSAALHQISIGQFTSTTVSGATVSSSGSIAAATSGTYAGYANTSAYAVGNGLAGKRPDAEYGYAVQAGVKLKLGMIAPGDELYLQASWGRGARSYTGATPLLGGESQTGTSFGRFTVNTNDAYLDAQGNLNLVETWSAMASFLHYWTPTVRQAVFVGYSGSDFGKKARSVYGPLYAGLGGSLIPAGGVFTAQQAVNFAYSPLLKDYTIGYIGTNVVWSPVKDLDIGAEVAYARVDVSGRVTDANKAVSYSINGVSYPKTASYDDVWQGRIRVQRSF